LHAHTQLGGISPAVGLPDSSILLLQANEISAAHTDPHAWVADGPDSTVFGVEPNFGCCTANFNQVNYRTRQHPAATVIAEQEIEILGEGSSKFGFIS
jgi:hypothetical protein